jgi:hypothetical protein
MDILWIFNGYLWIFLDILWIFYGFFMVTDRIYMDLLFAQKNMN